MKSPQRRPRISTVLNFFREGHPDEIRAVFHILTEEGLVPRAPKVRGKRRLNTVEITDTPERAEGVGA